MLQFISKIKDDLRQVVFQLSSFDGNLVSLMPLFILNFVNIIGLFPLLSNAAMNVRSILLTVYENHFVPLGDRLRPGLNGFLSGRIKKNFRGRGAWNIFFKKLYFYNDLFNVDLGPILLTI